MVVNIQSPSHVQLFSTPQTTECQASLSFTISWSLHKFMSVASVMPSSHLILWLPLLFSVFPSIRDFSNESAVCSRWPKYWSFSFSISSSSEYSGLISVKIDWFGLLAVQCTLGHLLQHYSVKASIIWYSAFFVVQLSQPYMTTGKTIALTIQTFVSRVMSLLFNILSKFIIAFLPRSNHLISWLQSPSTVILEYKKKKSVTSFTFSPSICHEVIGLNAMIFSSVQFSYSVMSDSLWPHGLQHARSPCPSPTPGVYSTHVHWVIDAMQPSHPLLSPSPPTFNLSQHQSLIKWVSSLHQVVKVLEFQLQHQSFQWIFGTDL